VRRELTEASPNRSPRLQADLARIFRDPTLSDEERIRHVTLAIRQDIASGDEEQARLVRGLETRSPSTDVETLKLTRLLDQRAQQFDMLRQVIDKYNQQAKGTIDSMGR
jgi:hypothetical protein